VPPSVQETALVRRGPKPGHHGTPVRAGG
jgi:hypothetical protein